MPLAVTVCSHSAKRPSNGVRPHQFAAPLPGSSIIRVSDGILVSSIELCFFQMASQLPLVKLIELGYELCGSYSLYSGSDTGTGQGFVQRPPLTSVKGLQALTLRMGEARWKRNALAALRYITDGSASPMETILAIQLTLPYKYGGYGFPMPQMNSRVDPVKAVKQSANRAYYRCDLYWPEAKLAVEYDSNAFHTGEDRIDSDSRRRNVLDSAGVDMITITSRQIRDVRSFEQAARLIALKMGKRLRYKRAEFARAQSGLRNSLFDWLPDVAADWLD